MKTERRRKTGAVERKPKPAPLTARSYQPTPEQQAALDRVNSANGPRTLVPRLALEMTPENVARITPDFPNESDGNKLLAASVGAETIAFYDGVLSQLLNVAIQNPTRQETDLNFMLSLMAGAKPRDHVEAALVAQMAVSHVMAMECARRFPKATTPQAGESACREFNRLARTSAVIVDTLKRYRSTGEQRVKVDHFHQNVQVNEGGQAVVAGGDFNSQPRGHRGGPSESGEQSHETTRLTHAAGEAVPSHVEALAEALPVAGR